MTRAETLRQNREGRLRAMVADLERERDILRDLLDDWEKTVNGCDWVNPEDLRWWLGNVHERLTTARAERLPR